MGVKSVENSTHNKETLKYPYIGIGKHKTVVLMTAINKGFVLVKDEVYEVGYYSESWEEAGFKLYEGSITLENT